MTEPDAFPRVQAIPGVDAASLVVDGQERAVYHFGRHQRRPFLFPVRGPSGRMLTRMGHPNPVGHEHHKSVWFGHQKVSGVNFWEEPRAAGPQPDVSLRHRRVVLYQDGPDWAGFVAEIDWWALGRPLMRQRLTVAIEPLDDGGHALDLQSRFEAVDRPVELGRTNFGFLGVRVARTMSEQFGGGRLSNSEGGTGEPELFGKSARWVDYSGPVAPGVIEGIAYFDHPDNPGHPTAWHVRRDGWMEAAFTLRSAHGLADGHPLDLRYRLLVHPGRADRDRLDREWTRFAETPAYVEVPVRGQALPGLRRGRES